MKRTALVAMGLCGVAAACDGIHGGSASLRYDVEYAHRVSRDAALDGIADLGLAARGSAGGEDLGYLVGADLRLGVTVPAGFAYAARLYLAGVRLTVAPLLLSLGTGIGVSDAVDTRDAAFEVPAEAAVELSLGEHVRLMLRARLAWLPGSTNRRHGAPDVPFADEAHLDVALRLGPNGESYGAQHGYGYFLGVSLHETDSAHFLGVVFGHLMDIDFERE